MEAGAVVTTYEQHCADIEVARGHREIDAFCAHCNQHAEQHRTGWSHLARWETWRCETCDEPVCARCHTKLEDEEITCKGGQHE